MTQLVGILNITPDSFSDGGLYDTTNTALAQAATLFKDGATFIDSGAESTRPNATELTADEEWQRLETILPALISTYPGKISVDSYHPETIARAMAIGPIIVNDVTGLNDPEMVAVVLRLKPPKIIINHVPGGNIPDAHRLVPVVSINEVRHDLLSKAHRLEQAGFDRSNIILDPGIGFGKPAELNRQLLEFGDVVPNYQVMIGYSRKRFLGENRMQIEPNLEAGRIAISHHAAYLRVHDVAGHATLVTG